MSSVIVNGLISLFCSEITVCVTKKNYLFPFLVQIGKDLFKLIKGSNRVTRWPVQSKNKKMFAPWWFNLNTNDFQIINRDIRTQLIFNGVPDINRNTSSAACPV